MSRERAEVEQLDELRRLHELRLAALVTAERFGDRSWWRRERPASPAALRSA